jgi:hypothetical protein
MEEIQLTKTSTVNLLPPSTPLLLQAYVTFLLKQTIIALNKDDMSI